MAVEYLERRATPRVEELAPSRSKEAAGWVLALTSVASFMVALDTLVVANALSTIRIDLGASIESLQWTANAYNLSFAALLVTGAALGDHFGRRRMMVIGLALFTKISGRMPLASAMGRNAAPAKLAERIEPNRVKSACAADAPGEVGAHL